VDPRRLATAGVLALVLASVGCHKATADCPAPPPVVCPEAGAPSFAGDVLPNVIVPVCQNCHAPGETEASIPFLTYQQIYGRIGTVFTDVFQQCNMPPSDAPVPLDDEQRQKLFDWYACGAPDSPAADASAGD
jgi:hypothetical protein